MPLPMCATISRRSSVAPALRAGVAPGHGLGVQRVADEDAVDQRRAGEARAGLPLVHRDGIDDVGTEPAAARSAEPGPRRDSRRARRAAPGATPRSSRHPPGRCRTPWAAAGRRARLRPPSVPCLAPLRVSGLSPAPPRSSRRGIRAGRAWAGPRKRLTSSSPWRMLRAISSPARVKMPILVDVVPGLMARTRLRGWLMPHLGRKSVYPRKRACCDNSLPRGGRET